jgi:hypothetical protein
MQTFPRSRKTMQYVIGGALVVTAVAGLVLAGQFMNPAPTEIVVAVNDIPAGAVLTRDMVASSAARLHPKVLAQTVLANEIDAFLGGVVVEPIHAYEPLPKAALSAAGNPAAAHRLALVLTDARMVAMNLPVNVNTAPEAIVPGDYVDLTVGLPGATNGGATLTTAATPAANFAPLDFMPPAAALGAADAQPTATATPEPLLVAPVAKTIISNALVVQVQREAPPSTGSSADSSAASQPGRQTGIVVAIPRELQELLQFGIDNGTVRVGLLSARLEYALEDSGQHLPSLGMTWNDFISQLRVDRKAALAGGGPPAGSDGPGAYAIEATRNVASQATAQALAPTATPVQ